jgi:hypothetical protein
MGRLCLSEKSEPGKETSMKKMNLLVLAAVLLAISGCSGSSAFIKASSISVRSDVFQELSNGDLIPPGYADLRIDSSLKTHRPDPSENKSHGTPEYRLLINIDGQAVQLQGSLHEENSEPRQLRDPEAGEGIRYRFSKKLRLKAGAHKIIAAIPEDGIAGGREITLSEGISNSLVLEPIYATTAGKRRLGFYGVTSFTEGIKGFKVILNGKPI